MVWQNALVPLGTWVANEVVPRFLDTLSIAIGALNNIIDALKPLFQWFWDSVLTPIAQWAGGVFLSVWDGINSALQVFSDWCAANPEAIQNITIAIGSFFAAWKITKTVSGIVSFVKNIGGVVSVVTKLGGLISTVLNPWTLALAGIITVGVLVYKNWDTIKAKAIEIWELSRIGLRQQLETSRNSSKGYGQESRKHSKMWGAGLKKNSMRPEAM